MESNLLINLRKYRPRDNSDPLENFVTEAFAHLLRSSAEISKAFINLINGSLSNPIEFITESYDVSTQENFNNKFPDMAIKWGSSALVFEHKVRSELHTDQLKNYREFAQDNFTDYRLILITERDHQHKQKPDCALCWYNIFNFLENIRDSIDEPRISWYIQEFMELLKSENLGPVAPINPLAIDHYLEAKALEDQMQALLDSSVLEHTEWPFKPQFLPVVRDRKRSVEKRIGIEFCRLNSKGERKWSPGIFCGFIIDGADHKFDHIMGKRLHVAVVIDLNKNAQEICKESKSFSSFCNELSLNINEHSPNWNVVNNFHNSSNHKINMFHPFAILQPMDSFFDGIYTSDEQIKHFIEELANIQRIIMKCSSFEKLLLELNI